MTTAQLWAAALTGTLLTTLLAGVKFAFDAVTGRRVRRVSDGKAGARGLERTEAKSNRAHAELAALHRKVSDLEAGRENDQTEIAGLQRRVMGVIEDRDDLVRYITVLRAWIASGARPPAPDVPAHLADVLPSWIPVDGAQHHRGFA